MENSRGSTRRRGDGELRGGLTSCRGNGGELGDQRGVEEMERLTSWRGNGGELEDERGEGEKDRRGLTS